MKYIVRFECVFSKNNVFFDDLDDAMQFAKHIKELPRYKGIALYKVEYDYDNTVKIWLIKQFL